MVTLLLNELCHLGLLVSSHRRSVIDSVSMPQPDGEIGTEPTLRRELGWRNEAKLLHHAQLVRLTPDFGQLVIRNPIDGDEAPGHLLSRRRNSHELRCVGPTTRHTNDDSVA